MVELTVRLIGSLAVVVGLLLVMVRVGQRRFTSRTDAAVRVVHRQALTRSSTVTVVEVGSRVLVLGTTEHQVNVLAELDPAELVSAAPAAADVVPATPAAAPSPAPSPNSSPAPAPVPAPVPALAPAHVAVSVPAQAAARVSHLSPVPARVTTPLPAPADTPVALPGRHRRPTPLPVVPAAALAFEEVEAYDEAATPIDFEAITPDPATREMARALSASFAQASGPLAGSVLSASTWRQAFAAARGRA